MTLTDTTDKTPQYKNCTCYHITLTSFLTVQTQNQFAIMTNYKYIILYLILAETHRLIKTQKPNIIIIIADDLGHNDVGFLGSNQIPTPNLDSLAYNGIILDRFYAQATCTPSRAALLTGNYPIKSGLYGFPIKAGENRSIPLNMPTMPEQLKKLGYKTHLIGKWHLGAASKKNLPTSRGFDTHFGYWNGFIGYYNYTSFGIKPDGSRLYGFDLHDQTEPAWAINNKYTTHLFTEKTLNIIENHDGKEPLFLVLSHLAPHAGYDGTELGVPNITETHKKYSYIKNPKRRLYAEMVNQLDQSTGQIIKKLNQKKLLENSIILFFSDNGAEEKGLYDNSGSNWPLRGVKFSEFEGAIRTPAVIFSPLFKKQKYINKNLIHLTDWLPTFFSAAGGNIQDLGRIDGIDQWKSLRDNTPTNRTEILIEIYEEKNSTAFIKNSTTLYKYLQGTYFNGSLDSHMGESGRDQNTPSYNYQAVLNSSTHKILQNFGNILTQEQIDHFRIQVDLSWCRSQDETFPIDCTQGCLFDLITDPCETKNIIDSKIEITQKIIDRIDQFRPEILHTFNRFTNLNSNPSFFNNTWWTWLDNEFNG